MANIPTLQDISAVYKTQAQLLAPVKTGAMRDRITVSYKKLGDFKYSFDLTSLPYIIWWNAPTISRTVLNARTANAGKYNFVYKAANSQPVKDIINEYTIKGIVEVEVLKGMQEYLEKGGFGKVKQVYRKK
jgi:hypothetical protein